MSHLRKENIKKCMSLLNHFIEESQDDAGKKGSARLALAQLQRITAGDSGSSDDDQSAVCFGIPRVEGRP